MITGRHHFPAHCAAVGDLTDQKMAKVAFCLAASAFCWCHNICSPWFFKALRYSFPFHPHVSASACLSLALCPPLVFFFSPSSFYYLLSYTSVCRSICNDISLVQNLILFKEFSHLSCILSPSPFMFSIHLLLFLSLSSPVDLLSSHHSLLLPPSTFHST